MKSLVKSKLYLKSLLLCFRPMVTCIRALHHTDLGAVFFVSHITGVLLKSADNTLPPWVAPTPMSISISVS